MKPPLIFLRLAIWALSFELCATLPAQTPEAPMEGAGEHYLLEISCDPTDRDSLTGSLRTALALREDGSKVTVFIESAAVMVADPRLEVQTAEARREIGRLFDKARVAGIAMLVCPHCADQLSIDETSLRTGLRITDAEELEAERERADKIYQFRPAQKPAIDAEPVAGCQPGA